MRFFLVLLWLIPAFFIASRAQKQGRSYILFLILGFILGPVLGYIILSVAGENTEVLRKRNIAEASADVDFPKLDDDNDKNDNKNTEEIKVEDDDSIPYDDVFEDKWKCANCNTVNNIFVVSCKKCGKSLKQ